MVNIIPYDKNFEDYVWAVFNYYNGKINTFHPATLEIDWTGKYYFHQYIQAYTILPNRVFFNPMVICRYCPDEKYLKFQIVEFMIHELFHIDQVIQYKRMNDEYYKHDIEAAVEKQTATYMKEHIEEIKNNLGVYVDEGCMNYLDVVLETNKYYMMPYEKRTPADHLWMILDQLTPLNYDSSEIRDDLKRAIDEGYAIVLGLNGSDCTIRYEGEKRLGPMVQCLDSIFYDVFDGVIQYGNVKIHYNDKPKFILIDTEVVTSKPLCLLVPNRSHYTNL